MNPCLAGFRQFLEILAEPSAAAQPRQGALHHPPARQYLEAMAVWIAPHHAQYPSPSGPSPLHQHRRHRPRSTGAWGTGSAACSAPTWRRPGPGCWPHVPLRSRAGRSYPLRCGVCAQIPSCLRRNPEAPLFRGLHRLAVNDGSTGCSITSFPLPDLAPQRLLNPLPCAIGPPLSEVPPHCAPGGQVMGHHSPRYAASQYVQYAVYYLLQFHCPSPPSGRRGRQQSLQMLPLGIRQITGICSPIHIPKLHSYPQLAPSYFLATLQ